MEILTEEDRQREEEEKIWKQWEQEDKEDELLFKPVDLDYFFKPLYERGEYNHGLITCFNSFDEKSIDFIKKYTNEAYINGIIDKGYLDRVPQDEELTEKINKMLNESEEYRFGSFFSKLFAAIDIDTIIGITNYGYKTLIYFAEDYQKNIRPNDHTYLYTGDGWVVIGQFFTEYYKILQLIPEARKSNNTIKFLYYGCPTMCAYFFFYILVKNCCDVVIVSPKDYDYRKIAPRFIQRWIKYNIPITNFE